MFRVIIQKASGITPPLGFVQYEYKNNQSSENMQIKFLCSGNA